MRMVLQGRGDCVSDSQLLHEAKLPYSDISCVWLVYLQVTVQEGVMTLTCNFITSVILHS